MSALKFCAILVTLLKVIGNFRVWKQKALQFWRRKMPTTIHSTEICISYCLFFVH